MKKRKLGGLEVSEIGMGCMGMSHAAGTPMDVEDAVRVLRAAVDMGYTFFDTAKNYGFKADPNHNEKLLGLAFEGIRDKVVISSKCGVDFDYDKDPDVPPLLYDSSRAGIRSSVEGSLKRLRTDHIDLYSRPASTRRWNRRRSRRPCRSSSVRARSCIGASPRSEKITSAVRMRSAL